MRYWQNIIGGLGRKLLLFNHIYLWCWENCQIRCFATKLPFFCHLNMNGNNTFIFLNVYPVFFFKISRLRYILLCLYIIYQEVFRPIVCILLRENGKRRDSDIFPQSDCKFNLNIRYGPLSGLFSCSWGGLQTGFFCPSLRAKKLYFSDYLKSFWAILVFI